MSYLRTLMAGLRLALLGQPRLDPAELTPGMLWVFALLGMLLSGALSYLGTEPPLRFVYDGLLSESFSLVAILLVGFLLARAFSAPILLWRLPVLLLAAGLLPVTLSYLCYDHLLPHWAGDSVRAQYIVYGAIQLWWVGILFQSLSLLDSWVPPLRRLIFSVYAIALVAILSYPLGHYEFWNRDYRALYEQQQRNQPKPLLAESIFRHQPRLLEATLAQLRAGEPGHTEMYFLGFGGDGRQKVFRREVHYAAALFEQRFGTTGQGVVLANDRDQPEQQPMASVTNLERTLQVLGQRMNVEEDILFLFLTSHGSAGHELLVQLGGIGLLQISADTLARVLRQSGIHWRVILVSACYSGGFIDALKGDTTLVITSARKDRKSFGCEDTADFTYFGRAYFEQALNQTRSFQQAFRKAEKLVSEWETRDKHTPSEPQMVVGKLIGPKLVEWETGLLNAPLEAETHNNEMLESGTNTIEQNLHVDAPGF